jgi:hypothetical protein
MVATPLWTLCFVALGIVLVSPNHTRHGSYPLASYESSQLQRSLQATQWWQLPFERFVLLPFVALGIVSTPLLVKYICFVVHPDLFQPNEKRLASGSVFRDNKKERTNIPTCSNPTRLSSGSYCLCCVGHCLGQSISYEARILPTCLVWLSKPQRSLLASK